jgi:hypothetical protein
METVNPVDEVAAPVAPDVSAEVVSSPDPTNETTDSTVDVAAASHQSQETPPEPERPKSLLQSVSEDPKPEIELSPEPEPPSITYQPFKLPDGATIDEQKMSSYTSLAAKHKLSQETAQELFDLHTGLVQDLQKSMMNEARQSEYKKINDWQDKIKSDPILGGSSIVTNSSMINRMLDVFMPGKRSEVDQFLKETGAQDHPIFWHLMRNVAKKFDEPGAPVHQPQPTPDRGAGKAGKYSRIYNNSSGVTQ